MFERYKRTRSVPKQVWSSSKNNHLRRANRGLIVEKCMHTYIATIPFSIFAPPAAPRGTCERCNGVPRSSERWRAERREREREGDGEKEKEKENEWFLLLEVGYD